MSILSNLRPQLSQIGKAGVHALIPNDFEYYVVTLELTDSQGDTVEYLTFPVTPSSIIYDDTKITNIKKSFSGVTALDTETFVPKNITLQGTFGKKLRVLVGPALSSNQSSSSGVFDTLKTDGLQIKTNILNAKLKTGYGTTKVLEAIHKKSSGLDQYNRPNRLFLYIPPLGHSFLIKINSLKLEQNYGASNMMWNYTLQISTLANSADLVEQGKGLITALAFDNLQRSANQLVNSIKQSAF